MVVLVQVLVVEDIRHILLHRQHQHSNMVAVEVEVMEHNPMEHNHMEHQFQLEAVMVRVQLEVVTDNIVMLM